MNDFIINALAHGVVRWIVGTTVQTGIVVAAVMYFLQISTVSVDSRMTDIFTSVNRVESKADAGFESLRRDVAANAQTLAGYSERFNSIDDKFNSIRSELQSGLEGVRQSLSLIDPTAAEPLKDWERHYRTFLAAQKANAKGSKLPWTYPDHHTWRDVEQTRQASTVLPMSTDDAEAYSTWNKWAIVHNNTRGQCLAIRSDESGVVQIGMSADGTKAFIGVFVKDDVAEGASNAVVIAVGDLIFIGETSEPVGNLGGGWHGGFVLANIKNFRRAFDKSDTLIAFPDQPYSVKLNIGGVNKAIDEILKCTEEMSN